MEVDLQKNHLITWTETQGRFGNGQGQEYAEAFLVEYWRASLNQWIIYKDSRGEKVGYQHCLVIFSAEIGEKHSIS